ncbi:hypothetical protein sos41_38760 [Alphaproteobacteria bacterium SO-S41]|nr:hypothetical protein sos41_38760 [Alphaproteobacteria bacterium SO-S41]
MKRLIMTIAGLALASAAAAAEPPAKPPCENFDWPMAREVAAFAAAPAEAAASGTGLKAWPDGVTRLALGPFETAALPVMPDRAPKETDGAKGAWITLPAPAAGGTYQVTIDSKLWVDVIQDGRTVASGAHSSDASCPAFHKSVRFELGIAPVTLQFSGAGDESVTFTILPAS